MPKVDAALKIVLDSVKAVSSEIIELTQAVDRVLAEDIYANCNVPAFDNSAMDGFAVRVGDLKTISNKQPKTLEVIGEVKAGDIPKKEIKNNQAIRIMTGAIIPKGADSVVMVEDTKTVTRSPDHRNTGREFVEIFKEIKSGENIRMAGEDIKKGELIIEKGALLTPGRIGILASLGRVCLKVSRKPVVAILATGNEVIDIDERFSFGKVRSSNTYSLCAQVLKCGCVPKNLGIVKDDVRRLEKKISQGFDCDILLTSGGVSAGEYDLVRDALSGIGMKTRFWKVAMRPGKPLVFGTLKNKPVFGLPGNPVSSMISFEVFVKPALLKMLGLNSNIRHQVNAVLQEDITKKKGLKYFLRAKTRFLDNVYLTETAGSQSSGALKSMALADSLMVLDEEKEKIKKGSLVSVWFLN